MLFLFACVTPQSFPGQVASAECDRTEECYKTNFEGSWDSQQECVDDKSDMYSDVTECYVDHCTFEGKAAGEYLSGIRTADCDGMYDAMGDVSDVFTDCEDEIDLALCLASAYF